MGTSKYTVEVDTKVARALRQLSLDTGKPIKRHLSQAVTEYVTKNTKGGK